LEYGVDATAIKVRNGNGGFPYYHTRKGFDWNEKKKRTIRRRGGFC